MLSCWKWQTAARMAPMLVATMTATAILTMMMVTASLAMTASHADAAIWLEKARRVPPHQLLLLPLPLVGDRRGRGRLPHLLDLQVQVRNPRRSHCRRQVLALGLQLGSEAKARQRRW